MSTETNVMVRRIIAHAMLVLIVGVVAGVLLTFSLLGEVALWPLPAIDWQIFGSTRGWQAAHVGGILNAVMLVALAWCLNWLKVSGRALVWAGWGLVYTGWGNTVFYWAGNLAGNRGLSVTDTVFGPGDLMGALSYFGGASAMFATFIAVIILARTALRKE